MWMRSTVSRRRTIPRLPRCQTRARPPRRPTPGAAATAADRGAPRPEAHGPGARGPGGTVPLGAEQTRAAARGRAAPGRAASGNPAMGGRGRPSPRRGLRTLRHLGPVVGEAMRANATLRAFSGFTVFFLAFL